ncbi:MAG: flagellar hook-associated protein 3 FlgL [Actinomycetota bacterium]|nr:flagellar hook-associated protein 3 FlgL [Actinomycetota bacterium]
MASSDFRITPSMTTRRSLSNLQLNIAKLNKLQGQMSSMKQLQKPSDSPVGMVSALHYRSDLGRNDQFNRNIDDGMTWLNLADSTLTSVVDQLHRVRDLAIQGANASTDTASREALAQEVDKIRDSIIGIANTKNIDRPIFAGNSNGGVAYDTNGNYVGKSASVDRTVASGVRVQVNANGDEVFGTPGNDVFTALAQLSNSLRTNPTQLTGDVANLDTRLDGIQKAQTSIGARTRRLETMKDRNATDGITLKQSLSQVEDVDLAQVTMELQMQQVAYQAALSTTAKVIQPSLVDFLR